MQKGHTKRYVLFVVGGVRLGLTKPEVADLQSAAIAAMRPSRIQLKELWSR